MYNVAVGVGNIVQAAAIVIKEKGFAGWLKEIALKGVDTAATLVNAVAKVFNAEASKGLAGVIIGILAAALIIGTIAMVANTVKTEQNTKAAQKDAEAKEKQAEGAREAAEAAREELDAVLELTKAYEDALKVYEETGEGKEDLKKAAFEAIEAMGLLQEAILKEVRRDKIPVTLFLMNGFQLRGTITGYDSFVVVLVSDGKQQMIYKHAISTLAPMKPINAAINA